MITAGTIDTSFVIGSGFINDYNDCLVYTTRLQPDGKILVGGQFSSYNGTEAYNLIRLNSDGSVDNTFNNGPYFPTYGKVNAIELDSDGNILVGGNSLDNFDGTPLGNIVKLNSDGVLVGTFNGGFNGTIRDIKVQPDGKILVVGDFNNYNSNNVYKICRLNINTTLDTTFGIGVDNGFNDKAFSITFEGNGNILVGGEFSNYNGVNTNYIVRLDSNGNLLSTFGNGFDGRVQKIVLQPDGKILCGGQFNYYNGTYSPYMIRLKANGSVDTTFEFDGYVIDMLVQSDGRIVVGGQFGSYIEPNLGSIDAEHIIRLNPNGTVDGSFYSFIINNGFKDQVNSINELPNGNILIGGWFGDYIGINYNRLISLNNDELTYQYQYIYSAISCDQASFVAPIAILNLPTYIIGSNVALSNGDTISVTDIANPSFKQCITILSETNILETPTHSYETSYEDCESCLSGNTILALVSACNNAGTIFPIVVSNLYNLGDIISIPDLIFNGGDGDVTYLFNDCFEIIDTAPYGFDSYIPLPYIVNYQPKQSCEQCTTCLGVYYEYQDCINNSETGFVFSHQSMLEGNSFLFQSGTSFCKEVLPVQSLYQISLTEYQTLTGSPLVNSTVVYDTCDTCLGQQGWADQFQGDGTIYKEGEVDPFDPNIWVIVGPDNESCDPGWSYIKHQFSTSGTLTLNYDWFNNDVDEPCCDWAFYYVSPNEPIGNGNIIFNGSSIFAQPDDSGTLTINYNAGDWVSIGVYSTDCVAGPGVLLLQNPTLQTQSYNLHNFTTCDGQEGYVSIPVSAELNSNLTTVESGSFDDTSFQIEFPTDFNINFLGVNYTSVNVSSNPFITFGNGGNPGNCCFSIPNGIPSSVQLPGVFLSFACPDNISDYDAQMYQLYSGLTDNGNTMIIYYVGSDHCDEIATLAYGFKFYKNVNTYFDLIIESNTQFFNNDPTGGLSDGNNNSWLDTFDSSPKKAYRITDTDSVMSVTEITYESILNYGIIKGNFGNSPAVCGTIGSIVSGVTFGDTGYPGSMYFDGTDNTVVTVDYNGAMDLNEGSWTIEWFQYFTSAQNCCLRVFDIGTFPNEHIGVSLENGNIVVWVENQVSNQNYFYTLNDSINNVWSHFAITAENIGGVNWILRVFQNGQQLGTDITLVWDINNFDGPTQLPLTIGGMNDGTSTFEGYITNFRWTNGLCRYTSNFSIPTSPISVDGSQLLLLASSNADLIYDSSENQIVSQNNVTWSTKNPFVVNNTFAGLFYSDGTTTYESCSGCSQLYGVTIKECNTGEVKYVSMTQSTIERILNEGPIFGTRGPECYEMLDYCIIPYNTTYTPSLFYPSCEVCSQPFSANTESPICVICCNCGATGSTINQVSPPHPVWTNEYGKQVLQMNMVVIGGNGLNA